MPDISMCANKDCPLKENCYRFTAKPSEYQSYAEFQIDDESGECSGFWDNFRYKKEEDV